jgi:DNA-binding NtrC family response regulator
MTTRRILVIEDDNVLNTLLCNQLKRIGYETRSAKRWSEGERLLAEESADLVLLDLNLPDADGLNVLPVVAAQVPVIVLTAYGSVQNAVHAIKCGASEYLVKPINIEELEVVLQRALDLEALKREHSFIKSRLNQQQPSAMVGNSPAIVAVRKMIAAVAPSDMTVLIHGESGTGKELVASAIHKESARSRHTYVAVDCCTLQAQLFESELFGHEKGAFTGADRQKKGLIEGAEDGTLFLDEIGDIEAAIQAKLLRVLETSRFRRVGGNRDLSANVRIVAATNRDLATMAKDGGFRADLFYRLNAFVVQVPPLRDRRDDIPDLVRHFIRNNDFSRRIEKTIHADALAGLMAYDWPGNIRELRNMVERAIILSGVDPVIGPDHFILGTGKAAAPAAQPEAGSMLDGEPTLEELKRRYLVRLMDKYGGHRLKVAQALDISERNLYRLIGKFGIEG